MNGQTLVVPLLGEAGVLGSLGAKATRDEKLTDGQVDVLTTVARQIRVALESARLYRQRQESLQSYVRQVTQAQEEERLRIARELHDETAQELVHLGRKLEQLRNAADPGLTQAIEDLMNMARGTLQAVRRYSRDLRPSVLDDLGLLAAIEMVIEDTSHRLPNGARLEVTGKPRRLDGPVELALFRLTQEALRNIEKHANATSATVELDFSGEEIRLSVVDDGRGFAPAKNISDLLRAGKLGLLGMKERAELVGGSFELRSGPGKGTQVVARVPRGGEPSA
jgi:signal transduction histidine kinase